MSNGLFIPSWLASMLSLYLQTSSVVETYLTDFEEPPIWTSVSVYISPTLKYVLNIEAH